MTTARRQQTALVLGLVLGLVASAALLAVRALGAVPRTPETERPRAATPGEDSPERRSPCIARRPIPCSGVSAPCTAASECVRPFEPVASHRLHAVSGAAPSRIVLELVDEQTRARVTTAHVLRTGPGLVAEQLVATGGEATFEVRRRLPFDLRIEAEGYEVAEIRQTRLGRDESVRAMEVPLRARR